MNTLYQRLAGESISDALLRPGSRYQSPSGGCRSARRVCAVSDPQRQLGARPDPAEELAGAEAAGKTNRNAAGAGHSG